MKFPDDIRKLLGMLDPSQVLDPAVYTSEQLEEDLIEIDFQMREIRREIRDISYDYDEKIEEIAAAPEWEEDFLLREADEIENRRKDKLAIYSNRHDLKLLLEAIKSTRERLDQEASNLNIKSRLEEADRSKIKRIMNEELREKGLENDKVQRITDAMTDARDRELEQSGSSDRELEKHRKRAEKAVATPPDQRGDYLEDRDNLNEKEGRPQI